MPIYVENMSFLQRNRIKKKRRILILCRFDYINWLHCLQATKVFSSLRHAIVFVHRTICNYASGSCHLKKRYFLNHYQLKIFQQIYRKSGQYISGQKMSIRSKDVKRLSKSNSHQATSPSCKSRCQLCLVINTEHIITQPNHTEYLGFIYPLLYQCNIGHHLLSTLSLCHLPRPGREILT